ncbi:MAG: hypothetical protein LBJ10_01715, partial [Clostridiales bacterium]|nr:hypothetical protein [Clostridiales bacterium]
MGNTTVYALGALIDEIGGALGGCDAMGEGGALPGGGAVADSGGPEAAEPLGCGNGVLDGLFVSDVSLYKEESLVQFCLSADEPLAAERKRAVEGYLARRLRFDNVRVLIRHWDDGASEAGAPPSGGEPYAGGTDGVAAEPYGGE